MYICIKCSDVYSEGIGEHEGFGTETGKKARHEGSLKPPAIPTEPIFYQVL